MQKGERNIVMRFSFNSFFWIFSILFFALSLFFTVNVFLFKNRLNISAKGLEVTSGQKVLVIKVIDGDEASVKFDNKQFVVRIQGISSFNPTINDPYVQNVTQSALTYLEKTILNREVTLVFEKFLQDDQNRLIAYLHLENRDVGLDMVDNGLTLVYTKYPFSRMAEYLRHENGAMAAKQGLWGNPVVANRSIQLKQIWDQGRGK